MNSLQTLQSYLPMDKNKIKSITSLTQQGEETIGLEIYSPPILINDNMSLIKGYISRLGLELEVKKSGMDCIVVSGGQNWEKMGAAMVNYGLENRG